ncbi:hypothetical protein [Sphingomonas immobilis]|uniref:Cellulose biosynthesis protein BcsS n=1 Tax=Sphingomonas immobilis TaxID=3063997 RepID=A0ABT8ZW96_9SPHN|nr:hypothetical protein [Sphingomonas sp. CA1-15]MDO7841041.1 hypothetical protein [Sphingomonas sp. CA1-15]
MIGRQGTAACLAALVYATPAWASGVEHVVDDSAVETPGTCHVENWATLYRGGAGVAVTGPACTRARWPNLEIGGYASHGWDGRMQETQIALSPKWNVRDEKRGLGIALHATAALDAGRGRLAAASLVAPFTIPAGRLRFNVNIGADWTRSAGYQAFAGAQVETTLCNTLTAMAEVFAHDSGPAGQQVGLRWTPGGGRMDVDVAYGRYLDGVAPHGVSLGLTVRR